MDSWDANGAPVFDAPAQVRDMFADSFRPISELAPRIGDVDTFAGAETVTPAERRALMDRVLHEQLCGAHAECLRRAAIDNGGRPPLTRVK